MNNDMAEFSLRLALTLASMFLMVKYFELSGMLLFLAGYISCILINLVTKNDK